MISRNRGWTYISVYTGSPTCQASRAPAMSTAVSTHTSGRAPARSVGAPGPPGAARLVTGAERTRRPARTPPIRAGVPARRPRFTGSAGRRRRARRPAGAGRRPGRPSAAGGSCTRPRCRKVCLVCHPFSKRSQPNPDGVGWRAPDVKLTGLRPSPTRHAGRATRFRRRLTHPLFAPVSPPLATNGRQSARRSRRVYGSCCDSGPFYRNSRTLITIDAETVSRPSPWTTTSRRTVGFRNRNGQRPRCADRGRPPGRSKRRSRRWAASGRPCARECPRNRRPSRPAGRRA